MQKVFDNDLNISGIQSKSRIMSVLNLVLSYIVTYNEKYTNVKFMFISYGRCN